MPTPTLWLFDDAVARGWSPFSETRPVGELRFGAFTLRERALRAFGGVGGNHLGCAELQGFQEPDAGAIEITLPSSAPTDGAVIWLSRAALRGLTLPEVEAGRRTTFVSGGIVVGVSVPAGEPIHESDLSVLGHAAPPASDETIEVDAHLLAGPWTLVNENAAQLTADLTATCQFNDADLPEGVFLTGPSRVSIGEGAVIGPGVVLDTRGGPICLEPGVVVEGPARLVGPIHLGTGSVVFGGHLEALSTGPVCKLRGEISETVICGYSNKAHDGYLGHALLGRWVNLGAGTTNSDLKNNYSEIRVTTGSGTHDTGSIKVGVFLGDHVKTGIGTLLNTGTAIGAGSNVFGGGMPPKWVPPFSWSWPKGTRPFRFDRFDEIAGIVAARRGQEWPDSMSALFRRLHERTHPKVEAKA